MNYVEQRLGQELEQRLRFESFTSELLANCLNTPDAYFDSEIENSLARLAQFLGLDQAILVQWEDHPERPVPTHSWTAPGCKPVLMGTPGHPPWTHSQSLAGKVVLFSSLSDLPQEAGKDKAFFSKVGIKGLISVPLSVSGRVVGVLVLANQRTEPTWPNETVHQLKLLASVFASMIE